MQITFNTAEIEPKEAAGLAALLVTLHGSAVLAALEDAEAGLVLTPGPRDAAAGNALGSFRVGDRIVTKGANPDADLRAADGYPQPTATAAEAFGATPTSEVDTAGTPWDERIHSGSRGTNKDGTWTRRRNTPDETFDTVMAELKARAPGGPEAANPDPQPNEAFNEPEAAPAAPPPPPPAAPAAPPAPSATITFPTLMVKITKAQGAGQIDKATVDGFIKELGASSMAQLAGQPDKLAELNKLVDTVLGNG